MEESAPVVKRAALPLFVLFLLTLAAPDLRAQFTISINCQGTTGSCGAASLLQNYGSFSSLSSCNAAKSGAYCAFASCPAQCNGCTVTSQSFTCVSGSPNSGSVSFTNPTGNAGGGGSSTSGGGSSGPVLPSGFSVPGSQRLGGGAFDFGADNPLGPEQGEASFTSHYSASFDEWEKEAETRTDPQQWGDDLGKIKDDWAAFAEKMNGDFDRLCSAYPKICAMVCEGEVDCGHFDPRLDLPQFIGAGQPPPPPFGEPAGISWGAANPPPATTAAYEYNFVGRSYANLGGAPVSGSVPALLRKANEPGGPIVDVGELNKGAAATVTQIGKEPGGSPGFVPVTAPKVAGPGERPSAAPFFQPFSQGNYEKLRQTNLEQTADHVNQETQQISDMVASGQATVNGRGSKQGESLDEFNAGNNGINHEQEGNTCSLASQATVLIRDGKVPSSCAGCCAGDPPACDGKKVEDYLYNQAVDKGVFRCSDAKVDCEALEGCAKTAAKCAELDPENCAPPNDTGCKDQARGLLRDHGSTPRDSITKMLQANGYILEADKYDATPQDLQKAVSSGKTVLISVNASSLWNDGSEDGGHTVLVTGTVTDKSGKVIAVTCNDTATNTQHVVPIDQFQNAWSGGSGHMAIVSPKK